MSDFKVGCSPITSRLFAGRVLKDDTWGQTKYDVTDTAVGAVAQHLLQLNEKMQFTYSDGIYELKVEKVKDTPVTNTKEIKRFSTSLVWYHRSEEMPHEGNRIVVMSPCYDANDPMKIRFMDSMFYKMSIDAEWWAYVTPPEI